MIKIKKVEKKNQWKGCQALQSSSQRQMPANQAAV